MRNKFNTKAWQLTCLRVTWQQSVWFCGSSVAVYLYKSSHLPRRESWRWRRCTWYRHGSLAASCCTLTYSHHTCSWSVVSNAGQQWCTSLGCSQNAGVPYVKPACTQRSRRPALRLKCSKISRNRAAYLGIWQSDSPNFLGLAPTRHTTPLLIRSTRYSFFAMMSWPTMIVDELTSMHSCPILVHKYHHGAVRISTYKLLQFSSPQ